MRLDVWISVDQVLGISSLNKDDTNWEALMMKPLLTEATLIYCPLRGVTRREGIQKDMH